MVRKMTLAGVLAVLSAAACSGEIDDAGLDSKAETAPQAATETEVTVEEAIADAQYGPVIGEVLPVSSLLTSEGQPVDLSGLVAEGGGVVVFSRSAVWCPYCQKQMVDLKDAETELAELGMKLTVITYDSVKDLSKFAAENGIDYQLVSDTDSTTIIANQLLNDGAAEGTRFYGIPHPAVIILSANGEVRNTYVDTDYTVRPSNADVIAMAADVNGG